MARPNQAYKEHYKRQHRVLGAYLALHCWHKGYDAVIIPRDTLAHFHNLMKFTDEHISWLKNDIEPYFPHSVHLEYADSSKFAGVILSRVDIPEGFTSDRMSNKKRAERGREGGFRVATLGELDIMATLTEEEAASFLALIASGLEVPKEAHGYA